MFPMSISFNAESDGCGHVSFFCLHRLMRDPMVVGMFLVSVYTDGCGHISCFLSISFNTGSDGCGHVSCFCSCFILHVVGRKQ